MLPLLLQLRVVWASARARCYEADPSASPQVGTSPPAGWGQSSAPCDAAIPEWDWVWDEVLSGVPSLRGAANRSAALVRGDHVRFATLADHALYAVRKPRTGNRPGALENKPNVDIVHGLPQVLDPAGIAARSHARVMLCLSPAHRLLPPPLFSPKQVHVAPWTPTADVARLELLGTALHVCAARVGLLHLSDESGVASPAYHLWPLVKQHTSGK